MSHLTSSWVLTIYVYGSDRRQSDTVLNVSVSALYNCSQQCMKTGNETEEAGSYKKIKSGAKMLKYLTLFYFVSFFTSCHIPVCSENTLRKLRKMMVVRSPPDYFD